MTGVPISVQKFKGQAVKKYAHS